MVERSSRLSRIVPHVVLMLGVFVMAFPVYLAFIASTHSATAIVNGQFGLLPGGQFFENYSRILFTGTSSTTREPVMTMLVNSFVMAVVIATGKIAISIISAFAIVYFRFPGRTAAFWFITVPIH